jgi:hypothetical protein
MMNSSLLADDDDSATTTKYEEPMKTEVTTTAGRSQFLETSFDEAVVTRTENVDQTNMNGNGVPVPEPSIADAGYKAVALYDYQACE